MSLKLYYDLISQPARAVYIFLKCNNINFQAKPVDLFKGEQLTNEYKQINRFQKVPVIDDKGFILTESIAILRYLSRENPIANHWYPNDSKVQAQVDEYLEFQHHNTRWLCNFYLDRKYWTPLMSGKPTKEELIEESKDRMFGCFEKIENIWLKNNSFIAGDNISIADLVAACEIEQTRLAALEIKEDFPIMSNWLKRVRTELNPFYDEAHSVVYKLSKKGQGKL